jgi:hypothetical protein
MKKKALLLMLFLMLISTSVLSQETIYGTVSGDVQAGVNVNVYVVDCGASQPYAALTTDAQGYYATGNLPNGRYLVVPDDAGYSFSNSKWVDIPQTVIQSYDFTAMDKNTINLSVIGEGYFIVWAHEENAVYFTRSSSFSLNQENFLVNPQGYVLQGWALDPTSGERIGARKDILVWEQSLIKTVSWDGIISVKLVDGTILPASQIALAMFEYPENLQDEGNGLYRETEESGSAVTAFAGIPFNAFNERFFGTIESEIF